MTCLDTESLAEAERHGKSSHAGDQRKQVVFPTPSENSLEELPAIEDADAVEEHDQAGEADRPDDLGFRCERTDRKADEEHGADAEGEAKDIDLTDQISDADGEKRRQ